MGELVLSIKTFFADRATFERLKWKIPHEEKNKSMQNKKMHCLTFENITHLGVGIAIMH